MILATFPDESIPDGTVFAPHHLYTGVLPVLGSVWMVGDDVPGQEPWVVAGGVVVALVSFLLVWQWYPTVGAALTLLGLCVALGAVCAPGFWSGYAWVGHRGLAFLGGLIALDDAIEHAFPVSTPLDWAWTEWLHPMVQAFEARTT